MPDPSSKARLTVRDEQSGCVPFPPSAGRSLEGMSGNFEGKKRILGLLVNKIVLEGKTVRIRGLIPATGPEVDQNPCHIVSPSSGCYGRNTASLEFELVTTLA
jgi:hypothetical protein